MLVIHCHESDNKTRYASDMCLAVVSSVLKDDWQKMLKSTDTVTMGQRNDQMEGQLP